MKASDKSEQKERQIADRIRRAPMRHLHDAWRQCARQYAVANNLEVRGVLDMLDELASLHLYGGETWDEAQARAWSDCLAILERNAA